MVKKTACQCSAEDIGVLPLPPSHFTSAYGTGEHFASGIRHKFRVLLGSACRSFGKASRSACMDYQGGASANAGLVLPWCHFSLPVERVDSRSEVAFNNFPSLKLRKTVTFRGSPKDGAFPGSPSVIPPLPFAQFWPLVFTRSPAFSNYLSTGNAFCWTFAHHKSQAEAWNIR
jgi:hypothetical protein